MLISVAEAARQISLRQSKVPLLVGISGIDGAGKGFVAKEIQQLLKNERKNVVLIHADGWLNLPEVRFSPDQAAKHFYEHAIRFEALFSQLILPLKRTKAIDLVLDFTEETANVYSQRHYKYSDVDIILLEGIYLFKKTFRDYFDLAIWVDCTFETALRRAIQRSQEGLSLNDTISAYEKIYFPAQQIHFKEDHPQDFADFTILN